MDLDFDTFLGLKKGAFDHIPDYARMPAMQAIAKVRQLEQMQLFRPGLYYIALTDLSASTVASAQLGVTLNQKRVENFITSAVSALGETITRSYTQFVKEIGDGALFIFSSLEDLLGWHKTLQRVLIHTNGVLRSNLGIDDDKWPHFELREKTVVHAGEVAFNTGSNPISLAVNQVFKIEKQFAPFELGCTNIVKTVGSPILIAKSIDCTMRGTVTLPGDEEESAIWLLSTPECDSFS